MPHLAQHAAVGAGKAFDGVHAAVGVVWLPHCRYAVLAHVLREHLPVCKEVAGKRFWQDDAPLAVAYGNEVRCGRKHGGVERPRAFRAHHARPHHAAYVAANRVERKRWGFARHLADFSVGNKTCLYERLKTVADSEHKSVARF